MSKTLFDVIALVESKCNFQAIRFEPVTYAAILVSQKSSEKSKILKRIQDIHACSWHTAMAIYSTSYGAIQLMGFNLYFGNRYNKTVFDFAQDSLDQKLQFSMFLGNINMGMVTPEQLAADWQLRKKFALRYNGSEDYTVPLCAALKKLGFEVL